MTDITLETVELAPKVRSKWDDAFATAQVGQGMTNIAATKTQSIRQAANRVLAPRGLTVSFRTVSNKTNSKGKTVPATVQFAIVERKAASESPSA